MYLRAASDSQQNQVSDVPGTTDDSFDQLVVNHNLMLDSEL